MKDCPMFSRLFGPFLVILAVFWQPGFSRGEDVSGADKSQFQQIISGQIAAFNADDGAKAYSYAAPTIKLLFPTPDVFMSMVKKGYQPVYRQRSFTFGDVMDQAGRPVQEVTIIDANGQAWTALYTFERQSDGSWKIVGCQLVRLPGADV
jgi:uncharacterized protein DUF4864